MIQYYRLLALACVVLLSGCASIGPGSVSRDRYDYGTALSESWKRQLLLNVVKMRYVEPLCFMDVGQIVAAYSMETGAELAGTRTSYDYAGPTDNSMVKLGFTGKYTDRPTITYTPLTGKAFLSGVMLPLKAQNMLTHMQAGVSADFLLRLGVASINGMRNEGVTTAGFRPADPRFTRAVELIRALQLAGALRIKVGRAKQDQEAVATLGFPSKGQSKEVAGDIAELRELLGLDPTADSYLLVNGAGSGSNREIAFQCHALMSILASMSARVDVPQTDVQAHRAVPGIPEDARGPATQEPRVRNANLEPSDAFTSVRYRGQWFWVDDKDLVTKRIFSFIMLAFTLMDDSKHDTPLQLTVPTQ